jgi:HEAT repeat protein
MLIKRFFSFFWFTTSCFLSAIDAVVPEDQIIQRISAHLLIKDADSACEEGRIGLKKYPQSKTIWEHYITALGKSGNEKEMMQAWKNYAVLFPKPYENHILLEDMAWGVITNGASSSSPIIRVSALLGAFFGQDAKGIALIHRFMSDDNSIMRCAAVQLSSELHDAKLCDKILQLLRDEKVWKVRLEVIKAIGSMELISAKPDLVKIISDDKSHVEEKMAAIQALVLMLNTAEHDEVVKLSKSDRAGLRHLSCQVVSHLNLMNELDCIFPLVHDHCSEVRAAALQAIGFLRIESYQSQPISGLAADMLSDPDPQVAITAAWLLTLHDPKRGQEAFERWLSHESLDMRLKATAAFCACGKYALPRLISVFKSSTDMYVRMNLAIALIGQRILTEEACYALYQGLTQQKERWMWQEYGMFRALTPNHIKHESDSLQNSEVESQLAHLEVLNLLAIMKFNKTQEALIDYLQQKTWGISGAAAAMLLTEGDESALDIVKQLLNHPHQKVRVQAALILALWGRDEEVIAILQQSYTGAERDLKEKILEGIGRIGAQSSVVFLVDRLDEPSQSLRIIAASALLQCLYH